MEKITVYDVEAEEINSICTEKDITEAQLIQALLEAVKDNNIDIEEYI